MRLSMRILVLGFFVCVALALVPGSTEAKFSGPCSASINGTDMSSSDEASIKPDEEFSYSFSADQPIRHYSMQIFYGPYSATASEGDSDSDQTSISGTANISQYAKFGVGVYQLLGSVTLEDGSVCEGMMQVTIEGNPLTTPVGATAAIVAGGSSIALVGLFLKEAGILFH